MIGNLVLIFCEIQIILNIEMRDLMSLNDIDGYATPHLAVNSSYLKIVDNLVEREASLLTINRKGYTLLHYIHVRLSY